MRLFILIFTIIIFGCKPEPQQKVAITWFDLPNLIDQLVLNMDAKNHSAIKSFTLNNDVETKKFESTDSIFWLRELSKLRDIDLNSPQLRELIEINNSIKDDNSNLLIDEFVLPNNSIAPIKILRIYYLEDNTEIRQIYAELNSDNLMANSNSKIYLWVNRYNSMLLIDSLQVVGCDKTFMQPEREYDILTKTVW